jgi:hypothetical protein
MGAELQRLYADGKFAELLAQVDALSGMHLATPSLKKKNRMSCTISCPTWRKECWR